MSTMSKSKAAVKKAPQNISVPQLHEIDDMLQKISNVVFKNYLYELKEKYKPLAYKSEDKGGIAFVNITKWVTDKKEQSIDKLKNVYGSFYGDGNAVILIFNKKNNDINVYMGVRCAEEDYTGSYLERMKAVLDGNFPGSEYCAAEDKNYYSEISKSIEDDNSIAIVSSIPSEKSEKFMSQGIEKLLDSFYTDTDNEYTLILLAEALPLNYAANMRMLYSSLATEISPYMQWETSENENDIKSRAKSISVGINGGVCIPFVFSVGGSVSGSFGSSKAHADGWAVTRHYSSYLVKDILRKIEEQLKRLDDFEALGMWKFSTYVSSKDHDTTLSLANLYNSLIQGPKSYIEKPAVSAWDKYDPEEKNAEETLRKYILDMRHPRFELKNQDDQNILPKEVESVSLLSGQELAMAMNMPDRSINGLPVLSCAPFGRNVSAFNSEYKGDIELGHICHMHKEFKTPVKLNKHALTAHTFITGSTGAGKSNTVFELLKKANCNYLIVEPAKGEYKNVFGGCEDVKVYGTNPKITELLKIDPFYFPDDIAVSEHVDRLVEIFNVCWPMYAAMPAILKDAVIRSYEDAGWNMVTSECKGEKIYPSFTDVLSNIRAVLQESEYSADNKGDYTGSLVTRLKSLTNGINGQIFTSNAIDDEALFDGKVIVDLSRVGSVETKSLIMGLMVMKLQEYRLSNGEIVNELKHITVLEEAHNLLKRTSTEQIGESANMLGKSVEMLANSIAELRAFGEGFIIADQSPGLLDMSVIRNTNTKIIHRLPDLSDRELVGKAAGLNDDQIEELSRLEVGVAAIYQSNWIEPVLCKINEFTDKNEYSKSSDDNNIVDSDETVQKILDVIINSDEKLDMSREKLNELNLSVKAKRILLKEHLDEAEISELAYHLTKADEWINKYSSILKLEEWVGAVSDHIRNLSPLYKQLENNQIHFLVSYILNKQCELNHKYNSLRKAYNQQYRLG